MINTILFDLDGTLLPLDMDRFIKIYFDEMGAEFTGIIEPRQLVSHIWTATKAMVASQDRRTNEAVFMECFAGLISNDLAFYRQHFDIFYDRGFLKTKAAVADVPEMRQSVHDLKNKGYNLVIATNPIFPRKAVEHRIAWAGFKPEDFLYITSYEENHYCKPQILFYEEVLSDIGKKPEECLMVGNDVEEDMIAGQLGMTTYLMTDYLIHRSRNGNPSSISWTHEGTYQDFYRFVKEKF